MTAKSCLLLSAAFLFSSAFAQAECRGDGFSLMTWNVQTFGNVKPERAKVAGKAYEAVVSSDVYVMAVQEIATARGMETFLALLPGGTEQWAASFEDTRDSQDNAIVYRKECSTVSAQGLLFADAESGPDFSKARHPVRWARMKTGQLEYTLLSLHLTFQGGESSASARELGYVLDWAVERLKEKDKEAAFIIAGDFNLPTARGKEMSKRAKDKRWLPLEPLLKTNGVGELGVFVDEPTSRPHKQPANNYDHFLVSPGLKTRVAAAGRVPVELVDRADHGAVAMVSDHYPAILEMQVSTAAVRPQGASEK